MFDGVPADQFHQFLAASSRTSLPIPLSFPLHHHGVSIPSSAASVSLASPPLPPTSATPPAPAFLGCFDPYSSPLTLDVQVQPHHHHHHHQQSGLHHQLHHQSPPPTSKNGEEKEEREGSISAAIPLDPWSNDEVLALLRIRSSMENWFPEITWEHVSRKLTELGYHRSAEKCKEKFEEESRHFNSMNYNKNYRFFSDLDELYNDENPQVSTEKSQDLVKEKDKPEGDNKMDASTLQEEEDTGNTVAVANPSDQENAELVKESTKSRKRKRNHKFEMFKGFCEAVVKKIVEQQEVLHNKLIEDMVRRDRESIARDEAWKCQEMDRINKEIEMRAQEQAIACDRQGKIIDLLKKFTSGSEADQSLVRRIEDLLKVTNSSNSVTSSSEILPPSSLNSDQTKLEGVTSTSMAISHHNPTLVLSRNNPTSSGETTPSPHNHCSTPQATSSATLPTTSQNPNTNSYKYHEDPSQSNPSLAQKSSQKMVSAPNERGERIAGKRWPRDEVQALINLKCRLTNNSTSDDSIKEGAKGPLWERISQGMLELGYKRSSKRCKEKWENINKYFRKTKDNNKKRSLDSRTCPYFHQLSTLYGQGTLVAPSNLPENRQTSPENH
ncbi:trihelix transcription factor GTL2 [Coffea arabica]|uniref:Trihelix transcription factor GTL2 n=1 Tax=Coffea arabica TaxID=13443 RepID=A0A6P6SMH9_COFAR|nr:trihelix transcription factor GTL2-like [Coffea arabica]